MITENIINSNIYEDRGHRIKCIKIINQLSVHECLNCGEVFQGRVSAQLEDPFIKLPLIQAKVNIHTNCPVKEGLNI